MSGVFVLRKFKKNLSCFLFLFALSSCDSFTKDPVLSPLPTASPSLSPTPEPSPVPSVSPSPSDSPDVFRAEGKLSLYKTSVAYGLPDYLYFGETINFDASAFVSGGKNLEWEIYYSPNYESTKENFDNSWLSFFEEVYNKNPLDYKPKGSGSYLVKLIPEGSSSVLADGIFNVIRSDQDTSAAPVAAIQTVQLPIYENDALRLSGEGSYDDETEDLQYYWHFHKVYIKNYQYTRNMKSGNVAYKPWAQGKNLEQTLAESGLYYVKLVVQDELYDLAREHESSVKYTEFYVRPQGETADTNLEPRKHYLDADSSGEAIISLGDFLWFEIVKNSKDFPKYLLLYKLHFWDPEVSLAYTKYYFTANFDPAPKFSNWPAEAIGLEANRETLRRINLGTLSSKELSDFESFEATLYAYDADDTRYSF